MQVFTAFHSVSMCSFWTPRMNHKLPIKNNSHTLIPQPSPHGKASSSTRSYCPTGHFHFYSKTLGGDGKAHWKQQESWVALHCYLNCLLTQQGTVPRLPVLTYRNPHKRTETKSGKSCMSYRGMSKVKSARGNKWHFLFLPGRGNYVIMPTLCVEEQGLCPEHLRNLRAKLPFLSFFPVQIGYTLDQSLIWRETRWSLWYLE